MDPNAAMEAAAESAKAFTKLQEIFQKMFNNFRGGVITVEK